MIFAILHLPKAFHLGLIRLLALSEILLYIVFSDFHMSCPGAVASWNAFLVISSAGTHYVPLHLPPACIYIFIFSLSYFLCG